MAGLGSFLKAILAPALIALVAYISLSHFILPFIRRHRERYNQYLPVNGGLSSLSEGAVSLRQRLGDALMTFFLPSRARRHFVVDGSRDARSSEEVMFDDEEGEGMVGFDIDDRRREALERRRSNLGDEDRRLSRDLEEGFRDDSDEETDRRRTA